MKIRFDLRDKHGPLHTINVSAPCVPRIGEDLEIGGTDYGQVRSVVWVLAEGEDSELEAVVTVR